MSDLRCPHCNHPLQLTLASPGTQVPARSPLDLHEAITVYCAEQRVTGAWSVQWAPTAEAHLRRFETSQLPLDRSGVAAWRQGLLGSSKTPRTVNSHLASLGAFCQWLVNRGDLETNPARGQQVKARKGPASEERLAFAPTEVRALLDWTRAHAPQPGFWGLVWTMAYTGARNEEVAQLRLGDLKDHEGITVLDLATMEDGQRRKTSASRRLVPLHTHLREALGACVRMVPNNAGTMQSLLGLQEVSGRWAYSASRWVNDQAITKLKLEGKIRDDSRLTLYSLRHSVVTQLKHKGAPEDLIAELVGHTNTSMTTGRYGKRYPVAQLGELVEQLEW